MDVFVFEHFTATSPLTSPLQVEGEAMRSAVANDLMRIAGVRVIGGTSCHPTTSTRVMEHFVAHCVAADAALIIAPETRGLLSLYTRLARKHCARVLNADSAVIDWASNKNRTADHLRSMGIACPESIRLDSIRLPAVVKPVDGAGSVGVIKMHTEADSVTLKDSDLSRVRIERFCDGIPASVGVLCGVRSPEIMPPMHQLMGQNSFEYRGSAPLESKQLADRARALVQPLLPCFASSYGWIGVDLVLGASPHGEDDVIIEVNPRLTSSYLELRRRSSRNLAAEMLGAFEFASTVARN